ncbi:DUF4037 domain-containing protein [Jatrophihabitans sp.]|jgi:hypothetical protein|uniref:DUF4037 domain-containing protein n=1 Tax=Jatrophihabitans sp. TaxID=1932789 RepID=UPI002F1F3B40
MVAQFLPGLELSRRFYSDAVLPILQRTLPGIPFSAARLGSGSEVLGLDTDRSTDHEWGPRLQIFLREEDLRTRGESTWQALAEQLPKSFAGWPTHFHAPDGGPIGHMAETDGPVNHRIAVTSIAGWFGYELGFDPLGEITALDWLAAPTQRLAENTGGAVFSDGLGQLAEARRRIQWYPDDLWRYALACQWQRISQEEAFVGRAGEVGDELGSAAVAARLVRDLIRLSFLLERRWAPYSKWLGSSFGTLAIAAVLKESLETVLSATTWKDRQTGLCAAYQLLGQAQNRLALSAPVDPSVRPYHYRPYLVLHAERFADALRRGIADPAVRGLPPLGTIDQVVDSTDVLTSPARTRAVMRALLAETAPSQP